MTAPSHSPAVLLASLLAGQRVLVCDGAMGTMLHAAGAALDRSLPELNLSDPGLVSTIHESYHNEALCNSPPSRANYSTF